ncbi:thymopoietin isoform X2 [Rana temporaria]|uniref:thymopoietin isoform X2 n=1 Tax=Rana temporaria TaxID=8407 RepID=UPI001AACC557|nr:thymopoietin isoform X2 [Rana temporaria]
MPEFLQDPSVLTKEKLKSELVANSVSLPTGEQRKEVYVKLYLQHLTARNRGTPDFSSDEEREATPVRGRGRPPGRKATKKTDKPSVEEKPDKPSIEELPEQDVTELTNEALKEELLKYGITHGPILANTRKLYEKKVIKAKEQVTSITSVVDTSNTDSNKQNGNSDPEHYSDNEESKIDLTFETREPIRAKSKAQITSRSRRLEQNETEEDTEEVVLNVKRETRLPPEDFVTEIEEFSTILCSISGDGNPEPEKTVEPEKVGRVQAISREESRVVRRTPRKRVVAAEPLPDDDADVSESPPITETILPSSNQAPVDNQVTETFKHTNALRSFIELSELSRRTPKKQPISEKYLNVLQQTDAESLVNKFNGINNIGRADSCDLLNTALIEEAGDFGQQHETPKKTKQLKITKFVTPKRQIVEKTFTEEKREDRNVLKEMFPYETLTPTGISATCRRPIKGAAGRPFSMKDYKIEEGYTSKYVSKYQPLLEQKVTKPKTGRSIPMWIKILIFIVLAVFLFLVYQVMETNEGNPFSLFQQVSQSSNTVDN